MLWQALALLGQGCWIAMGGRIGFPIFMVCLAAFLAWGRSLDLGLVEEEPVPWLVALAPVSAMEMTEWEGLS